MHRQNGMTMFSNVENNFAPWKFLLMKEIDGLYDHGFRDQWV
jgi:hypothetical protein